MPDYRTGRSTRTTRVIRAPREALYAAFVDADALVAWLPPDGMTGRMHAFDARVGGGYEMSLLFAPGTQAYAGKTAEGEDRVVVRFVELSPPSRLVETVRFVTSDATMQGEMTFTITLDAVDGGTEVTLAFDDLPPGLRPEDNDEGARLSLAKLAARYEGRPA